MSQTLESAWLSTVQGEANQRLNSMWFGEYNTWMDWMTIMTKLEIDPPELKTNYIDLGGVSGTVDLTEALTQRPVYKDRKLIATFWTRQGTRADREQLLRHVTESIHGRKLKIMVPDALQSHLLGRAAVKDVTRHERYLQFSVEATCDPWRYDNELTVHTYEVSGAQEIALYNYGAATLCPDLTVTGSVTVTCNGVTTSMTDGDYKIATFKLYQGENIIGLSGSGTLTLKYRRATL